MGKQKTNVRGIEYDSLIKSNHRNVRLPDRNKNDFVLFTEDGETKGGLSETVQLFNGDNQIKKKLY